MRHSLLKFPTIVSIALIALITGCASLDERPPAKPPLSLEDIVSRAKDGKAAEAIIDELRHTRAVYDIAASQYAKLSKDGVPDAVLDFLQQGQLRMARREARREAYHDLWFSSRAGWNYGYGYAWRGPWVPRPYVVYVDGKASTKSF